MHMYTGTSDFNGNTKTATLSAGRNSRSLSIPINNDDMVECTESFNVQLLAASVCGITVGSAHDVQVMIRDDDSK